MIHRGESLKAQDYLARQLRNNNIDVLFNTQVTEIHGEAAVESVTLYNNLTQAYQTLPVNGVFIAIGYEPAVGLARALGLELTPYGYITQENYRTSIPGVYSAGDVTGGFNQIVIASGQGSGAAMVIFEDMVNPYWTKRAREESVSPG